MAPRKELAGLDLASQKIVSLADGAANSDAATWGQVKNFVNGLAPKDAVDAASTTNVNLASPGSSMDGVTLVSGHRYLLKNQTTGTENGIYTYTGSAMSRAADMQTGVDARAFAVAVRGGTANDDTQWTVNSDPAIVGTDTITWVQTGAGNTYIAGDGLTETPAGTFNVNPGTGIEISSDTVRIAGAAAGAGLTGGSGSALAVGAGLGITVNADDVALASSAAGAGLAYASGVLNVGSGTGITVSADSIAVDTSVVGRKVAANVGDNSSTSIAVSHNLGTNDVVVEVYDNSTKETVGCSVVRTDTNTVTLGFGAAPTTNQYRAVIHG